MRKLTVSLLLCLSLCFCSFALSNDDVAFLKSLDSFSGSSLAGSYRQVKSVTGSSRALTTTGTVLISPEDGIAWIAQKPYASVLVVAKDYLVQQVRNNKPTRLDVSGNEIYTSIATALECVFFGDFDTMSKVFNAELQKEDNSWNLRLTPREKSLSAFIQSIEITGKNGIDRLSMLEASGDRIDYNFSDMISRGLTDEEKAVYSL